MEWRLNPNLPNFAEEVVMQLLINQAFAQKNRQKRYFFLLHNM